MNDNKGKEIWFTYGGWISKVMEHVGFNFKREEPCHKYTWIENGTPTQMRIDIKDGVLTL